jgi:3-hydroxybutyryl-CoA dehydrogenase
MLLTPETRVFVVGAGTMGSGIAQVAALAGHFVSLFDVSSGALDHAQRQLATNLEKWVARGKLTGAAALAARTRVEPCSELAGAGAAGFVLEAVSEDLAVKRDLFARLEAIVANDCVLASNTSSLSITALARDLRCPERVVGMHFFNPVPQMQLVEVVSGLQTAKVTSAAVFDLAKRWGKVPIHVRSTPGFVVNRIARPFYGEALALLRERSLEPHVIDRCMRGAGFRMGPCELMDLIGQDVNLAVTEAMFAAMCGDQRFVPSPLQRELVAGGLLGRKSGRGFFEYRAGETLAGLRAAPEPSAAALPDATHVVLHGRGPFVRRCVDLLMQAGRTPVQEVDSGWTGLCADGSQLRMTDGRPAGFVAAEEGIADVALFDLPLTEPAAGRSALAWTAARTSRGTWQRLASEWIAAAGWTPERMDDAPGLVVARTVAMIINEASDAVLEGVADTDAVNRAMKLAVNYPAGPFEWLERWDVCDVVRLLDHLDEQARGDRYRVSLELRQRAWSCEGRGHRLRWQAAAP